jgi:hypothetical protein
MCYRQVGSTVSPRVQTTLLLIDGQVAMHAEGLCLQVYQGQREGA